MRPVREHPVRVALLAMAIVSLAACGGSNTGSTGGGLGSGDLLVGVIAPFTGADAGLGPAYYAACLTAAPSINNNGGIGGRNVKCQQFDTRGEPADAVPAANQMIASNSNLMAVIGCTSDEAATVAPIIDRAHIPILHDRSELAIARVLMLDPHALILDEPTANLSPNLADDLLGNHVTRLAASGKAVLLVEQRARAALQIASWTSVVVSGTARLEGRPLDLTRREDFEELFLGAGPAPGPEAAAVEEENESI